MRSVLVMSTGLLLGCATVPVDKGDIGGDFVNVGAAEFAVFSEGDNALAVYLGANRAPPADWMIPTAQKAIEHATGCPILPDSLEQNRKTIAAQLVCSQSTSIFARSRSVSRGRTARSGFGPSRQQLAEVHALSVAEEQRKLPVKQ